MHITHVAHDSGRQEQQHGVSGDQGKSVHHRYFEFPERLTTATVVVG